MNFMTADVEIKVDDSKLTTQLAKVKSAVTRTVTKIKASFKKMGVAFKAVFGRMVRYAKWGSLAIAGALFFVTKAAMKQEDVIKRLEITLKATAYAAGLTKNELLKQAAALQQVTRFGDETITAMQTMLLTFKNIKGDEFKRATEAALDMAVAEASVSGRAVDLTAVSIRLGKALNDPILGLTALARVGVDFTDTQKGMIKELVRTGRVAEAQRVILKELESQFGGMSRDVDTASGALKQMWNALGDVAEKIGAAFIPGIKDSARAVKEWAERNQERIGFFAQKAVAHITYVKDVLWVLVKFIQSDWKAGIEYGLKVSLELFKGFALSVLTILSDMAGVVGRMLHKKFTEILGPKVSKMLGMAGPKTIAQLEARMIAPLAERLKYIREETGRKIEAIGAPPEVVVGFDKAAAKLKTSLEKIGATAEEIEEPMKKALVDIPEKSSRAMEEAAGKLRQWASDAKDVWGNLADVAVGALNGMSDALTDLVLTGKADFASLADSILKDLTKIMIKTMMAQALGAVFPGLSMIPVPSGQHGGDVMKTGLAVIHKGERLSGENNEYGGKQQVTLNMNVNAIDAAGTYQFLNANKRAIAGLIQGSMTSNHPLRRTKGWK